MKTEQLVPIIVKALREISEWPWHKSIASHGEGYNIWEAQTSSQYILLATVFGAEIEAALFTSTPLWLAQMVMGIIQERATILKGDSEFHIDFYIPEARCDFGISPEDYEWLKGKVGE